MRTATDLLFLIEKRGLGEKSQLASMPLTAEYLKKAPMEVYEFLMQTRPAEVEAALSEPTEAQKREASASRFFGKATAEESQAVLDVAAEFCRKHKEVAQTDHNGWQIIGWLRERRRAHPTLKDFEDAYQDLKFRNALEINEPEPVVSASQWLKEHSELRDKRQSPWGLKKVETAVNTFLARPDYRGDSESANLLIDAVQESGQPVSTQLLDALFKQLVSEGKIQPNSAVSQAGVTRYVDYR